MSNKGGLCVWDLMSMMDEPISFRVVKEPYGWALRNGAGMMTPFRSRDSAVAHATGLAEALRRRGDRVELIFEEPTIGEPAPRRSRSRFPSFWG